VAQQQQSAVAAAQLYSSNGLSRPPLIRAVPAALLLSGAVKSLIRRWRCGGGGFCLQQTADIGTVNTSAHCQSTSAASHTLSQWLAYATAVLTHARLILTQIFNV